MSIDMTWFVRHVLVEQSPYAFYEIWDELGKPKLLPIGDGPEKAHLAEIDIYWNGKTGNPDTEHELFFEDPNGVFWHHKTTIQIGEITNGNSLPKNPFAENWDGKAIPPCIHDHLYTIGVTSQKIADQLYFAAHKRSNSGWWRRYIYYCGVRIGGWKAWEYERNKS